MKHLLRSLFFLLTFHFATASADTPTYRDSATGTGKNPTVTITPAIGDLFVVIVATNGLSNSDLNEGTVTDNAGDGGNYWMQTQVVFSYGTGRHVKYAKMQVFLRDKALSTTNTVTVSSTPASNPNSSLATAIAISGVSTIDNQPPINDACGYPDTHTCRMVACDHCVIQSGGGCLTPITAGSTPVVPVTNPKPNFLTTSLTITALMNASNPVGVTDPVGWTSRQAISTNVNSQPLGMTIATLDNGFSGNTVTWGSTTPTAGNAMVIEIQ
jgi:hypothetical protein